MQYSILMKHAYKHLKNWKQSSHLRLLLQALIGHDHLSWSVMQVIMLLELS